MYDAFRVGIRNNTAYIYIWLSIEKKYVYVGQTARGEYGVIGRAKEHIQNSEDEQNWGTLRKDVYRNLEIPLEEIDDFYLFSFPLPNDIKHPQYTTSLRAREAVEYMVKVEWNKQVKKIYRKNILCRSYARPHVDEDNEVNHKVAGDIVEACMRAIDGRMTNCPK